jgi:hypothetical protein
MEETVSLSKVIKGVRLGLATYNNGNFNGVLGLGYEANEVGLPLYSGLLSHMVQEGLIRRKSYSMYVDDNDAGTGKILFGGIDTLK